MTEVVFTLLDAAGDPGRGEVVVQLVGEDAEPIPGYTDDAVLVRDLTGSSSTGTVTLDLIPNEDITPVGTAYKATLISPGRRESIVFDVPGTGGPYDVTERVTETPGALPSGPLTDHLDDTTAAHAASAVSFTPASGIVATNVQAAIVEVATGSTGLTDHLGDTGDAHDASAISFSPTGTVAATDVQAAIAEVSGDVTALAATVDGAASNAAPVFSQSGAVAVTTWGLWKPRDACTLVEVHFSLTNAGTTSTVVNVIVSGVVIETVTLTSGVTDLTKTYSQAMAGNYASSLTFAVTSAGSAATDLMIEPTVQ